MPSVTSPGVASTKVSEGMAAKAPQGVSRGVGPFQNEDDDAAMETIVDFLKRESKDLEPCTPITTPITSPCSNLSPITDAGDASGDASL